MKTMAFSLRFNKADYDRLRKYAKHHKKPMNKLMAELVSGSLCLCPHHDVLNIGTQGVASQCTDYAFEGLQLTYEVLQLLREIASIAHPEFIDLATDKREAYFNPQQTNEEEN